MKKFNKSIRCILRNIFFEEYFKNKLFYSILKEKFETTDSILELGAGRNSYIRNIDKKVHITAVDVHENSIEDAKKNIIYNEYIQADVLMMDGKINNKSYDIVVAFDLIEHFDKENGERLIRLMENIARKRIIIFTPNGYLPQPAFDNNPFQEHKSGWSFDEMRRRGFHVRGINGIKFLTGMYSLPRIRPKELGVFVRNISWILLNVFNLENLSFAILCIKEIPLE